MSAILILLAAGAGERLGAGRPKALVALGGRTLLARAVALADALGDLDGFVVAAPAGHEDEMKAIAASSPLLISVVTGGSTRQGSVRRALSALPSGPSRVLCHDVARPFASAEIGRSALGALERADGAVPAIPVADTLKRAPEGLVAETVPREDLVLAQTPQAFRRAALEDAHARAAADGVAATDDAALLERVGYRVAIVAGDPANVKITTPDDLSRASRLADA